jgi:hypothetical protein
MCIEPALDEAKSIGIGSTKTRRRTCHYQIRRKGSSRRKPWCAVSLLSLTGDCHGTQIELDIAAEFESLPDIAERDIFREYCVEWCLA